MPDYKQGKIYSIRSHQTDQIYIGSTTNPLHKRLYQHRNNYKQHIKGNYNFCSSFDVIKYEDNYIELVENFSCDNKIELRKREGEIIREQSNCLNKRIDGRTRKDYYEDNKERMNNINKNYYQVNREKILLDAKQYQRDNSEKIRQRKKENYLRNRETIAGKSMIYREANRNKIQQRKQLYYINKKDDILQRNREKNHILLKCECGTIVSRGYLSKHIKNIKHKQLMIDNSIGLSVFGY